MKVYPGAEVEIMKVLSHIIFHESLGIFEFPKKTKY